MTHTQAQPGRRPDTSAFHEVAVMVRGNSSCQIAIRLGHWFFPAVRVKLKRQLSLGLLPAGSPGLASLPSSDWNCTIRSPEYLPSTLPHMSWDLLACQFLTI